LVEVAPVFATLALRSPCKFVAQGGSDFASCPTFFSEVTIQDRALFFFFQRPNGTLLAIHADSARPAVVGTKFAILVASTAQQEWMRAQCAPDVELYTGRPGLIQQPSGWTAWPRNSSVSKSGFEHVKEECAPRRTKNDAQAAPSPAAARCTRNVRRS